MATDQRTFKRYRVYCDTESKWVEENWFHLDTDAPAICPNNSTHTLSTTKDPECLEEWSSQDHRVQKGTQHMVQYQNMHLNLDGVTEFQPIILEAPSGYEWEVLDVSVVWNEFLELPVVVIWEVQIPNPTYDDQSPESWPDNPQWLAVSQYYYKGFSALWSGSHKRPLSDGPTREMRHIFEDRNNPSNREPLILGGAMGTRVYAYATDDAKHAEGQGSSYEIINGILAYTPYTECAKTNGLYANSKAAFYPQKILDWHNAFDPAATAVDDRFTFKILQTDDCFTLNAVGALFPYSV